MRKIFLRVLAPLALVAATGCESSTTDPGGDGIPVAISFAPCIGDPDAPTWLAFQDGSAAWTRVTAAAGAYNFTMKAGKGGIATYSSGDGLFIAYGTSAELKANVPNCTGTVRSVSGSITGYTSLDAINVQMGESGVDISGTQTAPAAFTLTNVGANVQDLLAVRFRTTATATTFQQTPSNVLIRRGVTGSTTAALDFNSTTEGGAPVARTLTVTNIAAGEVLDVQASVALTTMMQNISFYENAAGLGSGAITAPFHGLASSRLAAGEQQTLNVSVTKPLSSSSEESRFAAIVYTDAVDKSVTLGPILGTFSVTGSARPRASYTIQTGYDQLWDVVFAQGSGASLRQVEVLMTRGYLGASATSVTLAVPDLGGVSGFQSSWLLLTGSVSSVTFTAANADISVLNNKAVAYLGAERTNNFTP